MKVQVNLNYKKQKALQVNSGQLFSFFNSSSTSEIYMKVYSSTSSCMAINLSNGQAKELDPNQEVYLLNEDYRKAVLNLIGEKI